MRAQLVLALGLLAALSCSRPAEQRSYALQGQVQSIDAARNLALCVADSEKMSAPVKITADYAYFRLRDEGYQADDIKRWADTIAKETASCSDVYVYFKHEEQGKGPEFAKLLMTHLGLLT